MFAGGCPILRVFKGRLNRGSDHWKGIVEGRKFSIGQSDFFRLGAGRKANDMPPLYSCLQRFSGH